MKNRLGVTRVRKGESRREMRVAIQGNMRGSCDGNILFLDCVDVNILVVIYYGFAMLPLGETR